MPRVYHVNDPNCPKDVILIDRTPKYGNPHKIGKDGNREDVNLKFCLPNADGPSIIKLAVIAFGIHRRGTGYPSSLKMHKQNCTK